MKDKRNCLTPIQQIHNDMVHTSLQPAQKHLQMPEQKQETMYIGTASPVNGLVKLRIINCNNVY
jgi:hypothetical protein